MLKNAHNVSYLSVPRELILEAATRFLQRLAGDDPLVPAAEIASPDLGAPDLTFIRRGAAGVTVAMVHRWGSFAGFALRAAAYHRWLKECVCLSETILSRTIGANTYIISHDVPPVDSYLLKVISDIPGLFFIGYQILEIEEQQAPAILFDLLPVGPGEENDCQAMESKTAVHAAPEAGQSSLLNTLSPQEIEAFNFLKDQYLSKST